MTERLFATRFVPGLAAAALLVEVADRDAQDARRQRFRLRLD